MQKILYMAIRLVLGMFTSETTEKTSNEIARMQKRFRINSFCLDVELFNLKRCVDPELIIVRLGACWKVCLSVDMQSVMQCFLGSMD